MASTVPEILRNRPALRKSALAYYARLGYTPERLADLRGYLLDGHCVDDASLFQAVQTIVDWVVPRSSEQSTSLANTAWEIARVGNMSLTAVAAGLWLIAKYGAEDEREAFVEEMFHVWGSSQWAARQVAAMLPLLPAIAQKRIADAIVRGGLHEGVAVLSHLEQLGGLVELDRALRMYVFHQPRPGWAYPFGKVVIARVLMSGRLALSERTAMRNTLSTFLVDEYQRAILHLGPRAEPRSDVLGMVG